MTEQKKIEKKLKQLTHIIVKSIHSSFCPESKILQTMTTIIALHNIIR